MKAFLPGSILVILSALLFVSCQKEVDSNILNTPQSDSSYIDKMIALDTTLPAGADTVDKMVLSYDNAKRVSRVTDNYGPGLPGSSISDFFYAGNDSLPNKQISREVFTGIWDYTDTSFYIYSNGVIAKDSTITKDNTNGVIGALVREYTVAGTTVSRTLREYNLNGGVFVLANTSNSSQTVVNTNGNLVSQTLVSGTNTFQSVQATYDNKPNPIPKALRVKYPEADTPDWSGWLLQKNNPSQVQYQEMGGPVETEVYVYTYRADGYPVKFIYSTTAGNAASNKVLFFYKAL